MAERRTSADSPLDATTPLSQAATTPGSIGSAGVTAHRFAAGDVLAGRYRIVRVAGEGGMGVVYEADDLELSERVAVKTLHAGADDRDVARLRREVQLARRVTHPNVCRIYDAGRHEDTLFVTMELLEGETLTAHIASHGRLSHGDGTAILRQLCSGLQAAHDAGVIHRDFKSANVMLVQRGSALRAVITDFGLARTATPTIDPLASHAGRIVGTPAYMAPEQVEGAELTPAVDIFALGVVAFEIITGRLPFNETTLSGLLKRLREPAPNPRAYRDDLDPRWEAMILRCLERDPKDRFASPAEVASALEHDIAPPRVVAKKRNWMPLAALAALLLVVAAAIAGFVMVRREAAPPATVATARPARQAVAILGFRNLSRRPDAEWLSPALSEMLATELAAAESLRLVAGEEVARLKRDLNVTDVESHSAETLRRIRAATGAHYVVLGSFVALPDKSLRVDVRVQKTSDGEATASFGATGSESDLFTLVANTGAQLRARLGGNAQLAAGLDLRRAVPTNADAGRFFAEGVARLRAFDAVGARAALEKAVEADPQFALAHAELSDALALLGFDDEAAAAAAKAVELSAGLPRSERVLTEAKLHQRARRYDRALELYRSLVKLYPDDPEHRVRLANALIENSRPKEALAVTKQMDASDPRTALLEAWALELESEYPAMLAAANRAVDRARALQNRDVLAEAMIMRAWGLASTGKLAEAEEAFGDAEDLFAASGNRAGVAKALRRSSFVAWRRLELAEARRLNERALKIYREVGQLLGEANSLGAIGMILKNEGRLAEARAHVEQALAIYRRIGDRLNTAWALSTLGEIHHLAGRHGDAIRMFTDVLSLQRELGDIDQTGTTLGLLAQALAAKGDYAAAEARAREALPLFRKIGDRSGVADIESVLGQIAWKRGDRAAARSHHQRAIDERRAIGESARAAINRVALAEIDLAEGNPTAALAQASAAVADFETTEDPLRQAAALHLVARANEALGRTAEARAAAEAARKLGGR